MTQFETLGLRAVIFDMDGLIFDTERIYLHAWPHAGKVLGLPITLEEAKVTIGRSVWDCEAFFQDRYGPAFCMTRTLKVMEEKIRDQLETNGVPLKPGAVELLALLRNRGIPTALGSSNRGSVVTAYLEASGLLSYFDPIVAGDMVEYVKPAPDIFQKAAVSLGVPPDKCLVLEDSIPGIEAASRAGCLPVMIPDLLEPTAVARAQAWRICNSLEDVAEMLFS